MASQRNTKQQTMQPSPKGNTLEGTNLPAIRTSMAIERINPERVAAALKESGLKGFNPFTFDQIRVPAGLAWSVKTDSGEQPLQYLDVVVLHFHKVRMYYDTPYDPANPQPMPPNCASYDGVVGVGDPGGDCVRCPLSEFGGDCHPGYFLYVLFPDQVMPAKLNLPRTSLQNWERYISQIGLMGFYHNTVITRIGLARRERGTGSVATFKFHEELAPELASKVRSYAQMLSRSIAYPGLGTGDDMSPAADPTAQSHPSTQPAQQVRYHTCNPFCVDGEHADEDATGTYRRVLVHMADNGRLVVEAFTTEKVDDEDDIPEPAPTKA